MKLKLLLLSVSIGISAALLAQNQSPYMGDDTELITLPNGGVINKNAPDLTAKNAIKEPNIVKVTDGVWSIEGYSFGNFGVIEGKTGLIIFDTGDDNEEARNVLEAIKQITNKPVHTIIYSHSHYVWGGRVLLDGNEDYTIIGHPLVNQNVLESGGLGAAIPELTPVLTGRLYEQFNVYLPIEGEDAPLAKSPIGSNDKEFVPVTKSVHDEEIMIIDGVKMQFFTNYHSDTDDCIMVYLPEKGVVLNNLYWPVFPNLYTLRGSVYRDPLPWMNGVKKIKNLQADYIINTHASAVMGKANVEEAVTNYYDAMAFMYDQTLRRILLGESPEELRHSIQLPEHLASWPANQFTYGELSYYPPNIYNYALGWFDGNAANINPVHPTVEASKIIEGFGGKSKVMAAVNQAIEKGEYAWATQLSDYLYKVYPNQQEVRQLKADALRKMGQYTMASIPRSFYLGQARSLENKVNILHTIMPTKEQILDSDPGTYVNMMRIRINPEKSIDADKVIVFEFSELNENAAFGLHIRRGVAEYIEKPGSYYKKGTVSMNISREVFAEYYNGTITLNDLLNHVNVEVIGSQAEARNILEMFDQYDASSPTYKYKLD